MLRVTVGLERDSSKQECARIKTDNQELWRMEVRERVLYRGIQIIHRD